MSNRNTTTRRLGMLLTVLVSVIAMVGLGITGASAQPARPADTTGPAIHYNASLHYVHGAQLRLDKHRKPYTQYQAIWSQSDPSGICSESGDIFDFQTGDVYTSFNTVTTSLSFYGYTGDSSEIEITATDCAGNTSYTTHDYKSTTVSQQGDASYSPGWTTAKCTCFSGGTDLYSSRVGASASFTYSGTAVALVTEFNTNRGTFKVYVDGVYREVISTHADQAISSVVGWQTYFNAFKTHTVKIVVKSGRIDVDAFLTTS